MDEQMSVSTHVRTSIRRQGVTLSPAERTKAQSAFLEAFKDTANVRVSAQIAGIDRRTVYWWIDNDETFAQEYKQAELDANDFLRAEIFRRAVEGYERPIVSMGKLVYGPDGKPLMERIYSDALMALLAKARMPEFREKTNITITTLPKEYAFNPDTVEGSAQ